jgi:hypothetical protein
MKGTFAASIFSGATAGADFLPEVIFGAGTVTFVVEMGGVFGGAAGALILAATDAGVVFGAAPVFEVSVWVIFGEGALGAGVFAAGFGAEKLDDFAGTTFGVGFARMIGVSLAGGAEPVADVTDLIVPAELAAEDEGEVFLAAEEVPIARVGIVADGFVRGEEGFDFGFLPAGNLAMRGTVNLLPKAVKLDAAFSLRIFPWLCRNRRCDTFISMLSPDDFTYALENTRVLLAPSKRLDTFGSSLFNYVLVTEEMDAVNLSRVREGNIHAERPQIITPQNMAKLLLEGFGDQGRQFAEQISGQVERFAFLKYGFRVSKSDIRSYDVHESVENVAGRLKEELERKNEPLTALLTGVDDGWEVCLLKFMVDMINASAPGNLGDFRGRGML